MNSWWVQSKPVNIGDVFDVSSLCPTDDDCCSEDGACTVKCKMSIKKDIPYTFRQGDRIAFQDGSQRSVMDDSSPGLATYYADGADPDQALADKVLSIFGGFKIGVVTGSRPNNSTDPLANIEMDFNPSTNPTGTPSSGWTFEKFRKWASKQDKEGCPDLDSKFIHTPVGTADTWPTGGTIEKPVNGGDQSNPSPETATWSWDPASATESFKVKNGAGKISAPATLTEWKATYSAMEIKRGTGIFSPFTTTMLDAEDSKNNFIGEYSVAYVDSGIVALPKNLQLCSRVYCPPGTYLNDNGDCSICDQKSTSAGAKGAIGNLNSFQQQVTQDLCKSCPADQGTPRDKVAAFANDPAYRKAGSCKNVCPFGMRRASADANPQTCTVCPPRTYSDSSRDNDYSDCKTCDLGQSIWDLGNTNPLLHNSKTDCGTCPLGYVGKTKDPSCSMCPTGKYDGRTLEQQLRPPSGKKPCSGALCDSTLEGNCAICPLGRSTFPTKTKAFGNQISTFGSTAAFSNGDSRDCQDCPAGFMYTATFPTFADGDCAQCPADTYQSGGSNFVHSHMRFLRLTTCEECKWGYGFDRTEDEKGTSVGACKDERAFTCPPGQAGTPSYDSCTREGGQNDESCVTCPENQYTFGRQHKCVSFASFAFVLLVFSP